MRDKRLSIKLGLEDTKCEMIMAGGACHDTRAGQRSEQIRKRGRLSKRSKMSEVQGAWKVMGSSCIDGSDNDAAVGTTLPLQRTTLSPKERGLSAQEGVGGRFS